MSDSFAGCTALDNNAGCDTKAPRSLCQSNLARASEGRPDASQSRGWWV